MKYNLLQPWKTLDKWQEEYIAEKGNCFLLCGRQSGKTAAMAIKIARCALSEEKACDYLVVAYTEKQAYNLFFKTLMYLEAEHPKMIKRGRDKPTMHEIMLVNGVTIMCYAAGQSGEGIRTFTVKKLFIDEAAPMAREVFISVSPMLSVTEGTMDLASTPRGKAGYFYECSLRDDFKHFYISAEDCPRHSKEFLESERKNMSRLEYAQEYLAKFLDELKRVFSDELIKSACVLKRRETIIPARDYFLGADIAGFGKDETAIAILDGTNKDFIEQTESEILNQKLTTEVSQRIIELNNIYGLKEIGIDDGGVGFGVFSELMREDATKRKTKALNNASRPLDNEELKQKKLLKEDMYLNLLLLLENLKIRLLQDDELIASLKSIQYEYVVKEGQKTAFRIFGNYTHIAEAIVRAAWLIKTTSLNIYIEF